MRTGMEYLLSQEVHQDYLRRLDARAVLEHYGARNCTEQAGGDGTTEIVHSCLLDRVEPHHTNGDEHPSACLAGDTTIHLVQGKKGLWPLKRTIAEIYQLWHEGIPHHYREGKAYRQTPQGNWATCVTWRGEKHYLGTFLTEAEAAATVDKFRDEHPYEGRRRYSRNVRVRSWDVAGDRYGRIGTVSDVWQTGVKPLLEITTESGKTLRCTAEHRVYSGDGWVTAGEIRAGQDWLFREGRGRDYTKPEVGVPEYLRKAIGVWTQNQRTGIIMPVDCCYLCGQRFPFEELELDHVVPVVEDLARALDVTNLSPVCKKCHRPKSNLENSVNARPGTKLKALPDRVVDVRSAGPEMTYDMEVPDWRNYTANGLVVHNSCNIDRKVYVCYSLGWGGNLFRLIQKLENKESLSDTLGTVGQFLTGATVDSTHIVAELDKLFNPTMLHEQIDLPTYSDRILDSWARPHPYWQLRGINAEAIEKLRLGYDEREGRIVFPHFVNGTLVGWQKRAIPGESKDEHPKYRNSSGFPKSETLYNLDIARLSPRVCVVESPMSVAHAMSLGIPNVVGSWGAKVSEMQLAFLRSFERVYVWFDRDAAGIAGEKKLVEGLYRHTDVYVVNPDRGRDMADCNLGEIETKLSEAVPAALRLGSYGIRP